MGITRTDPSLHPITLKEAKAYLRVDSTDEDSVINDLIGAATEFAQNFTSRQFVTATFTWTLDDFPPNSGIMYVPRSPLTGVTSIVYNDADGDSQTLASSKYVVSADHAVGRISLARNQVWPVTENEADSVTVTFTSGYSTVPAPVKNAIKMLVAQWYENREPVVVGTITTKVPFAVESLLWPYRVLEVA